MGYERRVDFGLIRDVLILRALTSMSIKMQIFAQLRRIFTLFIETFLNVIRTAGFSWVHSGLLWVRASSDLVTTRVALLAPGDLPKKKKLTDGRTDGHDYRAKCLDNGETLL